MKKIRIDTYFDITCDGCSHSWSTDYRGGMGLSTSKANLSQKAYAMGWKCINEKTLCPECVAIVQSGSMLPIDIELEV